MRLSRLHILTLLAVAKYRFLTNSQLALMGLGKIDTIRRATRHLASYPPKHPLFHVQKFPSYARTGRLEHVYTVTDVGQGIAADLSLSEYRFPAVRPLYDADFFHRRAVITFQFLLDKALDARSSKKYRVASFHHYFHKSGANHRTNPGPPLEAATKVPFRKKGFFIPDSIFVLERGQNQALFALECVFGNKTARTLAQVRKHMRAMSECVVTAKYGLPYGTDYVALFFFHDSKLAERVRQELDRNRRWGFVPFKEHFLFATIEEVKGDVLGCWRKVGEPDSTFNFINGERTKPIPA